MDFSLTHSYNLIEVPTENTHEDDLKIEIKEEVQDFDFESFHTGSSHIENLMKEKNNDFGASVYQETELIAKPKYMSMSERMKYGRSPRGANFSTHEVDKLVELIAKHKSIVECRESDTRIWQEKSKAWSEITEEYNSTMDQVRTPEQLKKKYDSVKKIVKRKCTGERSSVANKLTATEIIVKDMICTTVNGWTDKVGPDIAPPPFNCDVSSCDVDSSLDSPTDQQTQVPSTPAVNGDDHIDLPSVPSPSFAIPFCSTTMEGVEPEVEQGPSSRRPKKRLKKFQGSEERTQIFNYAKAKEEFFNLRNQILKLKLEKKKLRLEELVDGKEKRKELMKIKKEKKLIEIEILKIKLKKMEDDSS